MLKVIFIYASESSRYTQKMIWFIGVWATVHEMSAIKISNKMLTKQKSKFLDLNPNISETVSQPNKQYNFLKVWNETLQIIYLNCFNSLRVLAEVSTKLQKMLFFR